MKSTMRVIVFTSQKGGSGKSTLAGHLAVQAERAGFGPVAIIDTAPLGTLAAWHAVRKSDTPSFIASTPAHLAAELANLRRAGTRLVLVDTPPEACATAREAVGHADLVIVPVRPSPHDLRAVGATLDIVEGCDKPFLFVLNGATPFARITLDAAMALAQHGTVPPVTIYHRVDFASSMIDGRTVTECEPESRSAWEIAELWDCVAAQLRVLPLSSADLEDGDMTLLGLAAVAGNVVGFGPRQVRTA